jgi:hypothetical protein
MTGKNSLSATACSSGEKFYKTNNYNGEDFSPEYSGFEMTVFATFRSDTNYNRKDFSLRFEMTVFATFRSDTI